MIRAAAFDLAIAAAAIVASLGALGAPARADCPPTRAACLLQQEGADALAARRFDDARVKFAASLAAEPTARAHLGYAQAVEGLGRLAEAYDHLTLAQALAAAELAAAPTDAEAAARAERIKYKLGELRGRIALVRVVMPTGQTPDQLVAIRRGDDGELPAPLARPFALAPGQPLDVQLRDGTAFTLAPVVREGAELTLLLEPPRAVPPPLLPPLPYWYVGVEAVSLTGAFSEDSPGTDHAFGGYARLTVQPYAGSRWSRRDAVAFTLRVGGIGHSVEPGENGLALHDYEAFGGVRLARGPLFVTAEAGGVVETGTSLGATNTVGVVAFAFAVGARYRRFDARVGVQLAPAQDGADDNTFKTRLLVTLGYDLFPL